MLPDDPNDPNAKIVLDPVTGKVLRVIADNVGNSGDIPWTDISAGSAYQYAAYCVQGNNLHIKGGGSLSNSSGQITLPQEVIDRINYSSAAISLPTIFYSDLSSVNRCGVMFYSPYSANVISVRYVTNSTGVWSGSGCFYGIIPLRPKPLTPLYKVPVGTNLRGRKIICERVPNVSPYFYPDGSLVFGYKGTTNGNSIGSGTGGINLYIGGQLIALSEIGSMAFTIPDDQTIPVMENTLQSNFGEHHGYELYLEGNI
jgi:hypothetical protein